MKTERVKPTPADIETVLQSYGLTTARFHQECQQQAARRLLLANTQRMNELSRRSVELAGTGQTEELEWVQEALTVVFDRHDRLFGQAYPAEKERET